MAALLRRGAETNGLADGIAIERSGVGSQTGRARMVAGDNPDAGYLEYLPSGDSHPDAVPVTSIDDYCRSHQLALGPGDLIKADAEGADLDVLLGAGEQIRNGAPQLAITTYHVDDHAERMIAWLRETPAGLPAAAQGVFILDRQAAPGAAASLDAPMRDSPPLIVGLGEALYDLLPTGPALGGAPLNAAVQAHQLGNNAVVASRIGRDALGQALLDDLAGRGMDTSFIQRDPPRPDRHGPGHPPGRASRSTTSPTAPPGIASPGTSRSPAWPSAVTPSASARLASGSSWPNQRSGNSSPPPARPCGCSIVNLRQDNFSAAQLEAGCRAASIVKMNEAELATVAPAARPWPSVGHPEAYRAIRARPVRADTRQARDGAAHRRLYHAWPSGAVCAGAGGRLGRCRRCVQRGDPARRGSPLAAPADRRPGQPARGLRRLAPRGHPEISRRIAAQWQKLIPALHRGGLHPISRPRAAYVARLHNEQGQKGREGLPEQT